MGRLRLVRWLADRGAGRTVCEPRPDRWWRELVLAAVVYELYNVIQASLTGGTARALANGSALLRWEHGLHLDPERALNRLFDTTPLVGVPACYWYASLHFLVTPAVLIWTYRKRPEYYRRARGTLLVLTLLALLAFWQLPTAPPRLLGASGLTDTAELFHHWGWWSDDALPSHASRLENQYAAMPSLHVAWATWSGVTLGRLARRRLSRAVAVAYPVVTVVVVMGTGNHYLADAAAGLALWLFVDAAALVVGRQRPPRAEDLTPRAEHLTPRADRRPPRDLSAAQTRYRSPAESPTAREVSRAR